jgi:isocitrate dehydrogenase (NAD+)
MAYRITLIPGDGIGPEVITAARRVLEATGVRFDWEVVEVGAEVMKKCGTPLPEMVLESIRRNRIALKGPVTTPVGSGFRSVNVALRKALELYVCLRPCKIYPGVSSPYSDVDIVIVRENMEDLYAGIEFQEGTIAAKKMIGFLQETTGENVREDSGLSIKAISRYRSQNIVKWAFDYARQHNRKKVTAVHKANIMKYSDGLFLSVARDMAKQYSDIEFEDKIADNMCMQLVQKPQQFDVVVAPNLYGDLLSDLCAGLVGGLGVAPGANLNDGLAVFEPAHGSAPRHAGMNKVNPAAAILSGVMMLRHIGETAAADMVETAIAAVISEGKYLTYDLKPEHAAVTTTQFTDAIIARFK